MPIYFKQLFAFQVEGDSVKVYTAGKAKIEGYEREISFKGKGTGTIESDADGYYLDMSIKARTKNGGKLTFSLIARLDIDHSSAGIVDQVDQVAQVIGRGKVDGHGRLAVPGHYQRT